MLPFVFDLFDAFFLFSLGRAWYVISTPRRRSSRPIENRQPWRHLRSGESFGLRRIPRGFAQVANVKWSCSCCCFCSFALPKPDQPRCRLPANGILNRQLRFHARVVFMSPSAITLSRSNSVDPAQALPAGANPRRRPPRLFRSAVISLCETQRE